VTPYTWQELIELNNATSFTKEEVNEFLYTYGLLGAVALSVAKWHPTNKDRGQTGYCGLCLMYDDRDTCKFCPLKKMWKMNCFTDNSPYKNWWNQITSSCTAHKQEFIIFRDLVKLYKQVYKHYKKVGFPWLSK
jgi:hypothetical protein